MSKRPFRSSSRSKSSSAKRSPHKGGAGKRKPAPRRGGTRS